MLLTPDDSVDIQIKTTLKELILYIIFFTALLISKICDSMFPLSCNLISATLGMTTFLSATNFQFTKVMETLFKTQMEVNDDRSMWEYLEGDFLNGIYNEIWYNDGDLS